MTRKRIDLVLVERGLFESRAKARAAIEAGGVKVDGRTVLKTAEMVDPLAPIDAQPAHGWVGRGALKLDFALEQWPIEVKGQVVLDVGASTGGFTEVCLKAGARRVFAVDVGHGQLHPRLKSDPRVVDLEGVDARALDRDLISESPSLVVCDASFIGLEKVLPAALALAAPGAQLVALVKPQFQLGPAGVGKGGIVKNEADRLRAVAAVQAFLEQVGWRIRGRLPSPVTGGDGNAEYLLWACKSD
jgi:23S rRNA (cytidine1920-2'-O)/16S rRNA (cytidine1409-2'-O)-methyltransferase